MFCKPAQAQYPVPVVVVNKNLLVFLNDFHFQQVRNDLGLTKVSEDGIITLNNSEHAE